MHRCSQCGASVVCGQEPQQELQQDQQQQQQQLLVCNHANAVACGAGRAQAPAKQQASLTWSNWDSWMAMRKKAAATSSAEKKSVA